MMVAIAFRLSSPCTPDETGRATALPVSRHPALQSSSDPAGTPRFLLAFVAIPWWQVASRRIGSSPLAVAQLEAQLSFRLTHRRRRGGSLRQSPRPRRAQEFTDLLSKAAPRGCCRRPRRTSSACVGVSDPLAAGLRPRTTRDCAPDGSTTLPLCLLLLPPVLPLGPTQRRR